MISRVEIQNFQSHQQSVLELAPGVNVIIGPSDSGKSAIFRAINWVVTNRPRGEGFRSEWGGSTRVTLWTGEGDKIERVRADGLNAYVLNGEGLKAFGPDVPDGVQDVLRLGEENIQSQGEPPFLLAASPGEAARLLNRAASLEEIDRAISNLRKTQSEVNGAIRNHESSLGEYEKVLEQYEDLPILEERLRAIEDLNDELLQKRNKVKQLREIITLANELTEDLERTDSVDQVFKMLAEAGENAAQHDVTRKRVTQLRSLIRDMDTTIKNFQRAKKEIQQLEKEYHDLAPDRCPLCGAKSAFKDGTP